ncbi:MAG: hypothetical protein K6W08_07415 [Firmicutes bacterium]|nr:hypothetical protein [Bacillota bacterium]
MSRSRPTPTEPWIAARAAVHARVLTQALVETWGSLDYLARVMETHSPDATRAVLETAAGTARGRWRIIRLEQHQLAASAPRARIRLEVTGAGVRYVIVAEPAHSNEDAYHALAGHRETP